MEIRYVPRRFYKTHGNFGVEFCEDKGFFINRDSEFPPTEPTSLSGTRFHVGHEVRYVGVTNDEIGLDDEIALEALKKIRSRFERGLLMEKELTPEQREACALRCGNPLTAYLGRVKRIPVYYQGYEDLLCYTWVSPEYYDALMNLDLEKATFCTTYFGRPSERLVCPVKILL